MTALSTSDTGAPPSAPEVLEPDAVLESDDLSSRLNALRKIVAVAGDRVDSRRLETARLVSERAAGRLALSGEYTVIALGGSTGSGKSSLFNALAGLDISAVGIRRPTTGAPHACVWGPEGAAELLDWLGIPARHQIARESVLDADSQADLRGLILLDLPDHDSVQLSHQLEVDRLVQLVDVLVWVVDPQKYADEQVHSRYLRPLTRHASNVVVVLNHIDRLTPDDAEICRADLRRLLDSDGLSEARLFTTSAVRHDGLADVREVITSTVAARHAAAARLSADLDTVAAELGDLVGPEVREDIDRGAIKALCAELADASGVSARSDAAVAEYQDSAVRVTGWPIARWLAWIGRFRPNRGSLPANDSGDGTESRGASSTQVDAAIQRFADTASAGLPAPWPTLVRHAAASDRELVQHDLDQAVGTAVTGPDKSAVWWRVIAAGQWALLGIMVIGALWLIVSSILATVGADLPRILVEPKIGIISMPTVLFLGGLVLGPILALLARSMIASAALRARTRVRSALSDAITVVARERVVAPTRAELGAYVDVRDALRRVGQATSS